MTEEGGRGRRKRKEIEKGRGGGRGRHGTSEGRQGNDGGRRIQQMHISMQLNRSAEAISRPQVAALIFYQLWELLL